MLEFNPYQSSIEVLNLEKHPQEVQDNFFEALNTVPFIRALIDKDRPRAKDLPRDEQGKIIVDLTKPHILENMDYFRPAALQFQKTGRYTDLRPNINPNSEFGKWIREEVRRCYEGYVRESDGEWIPGDYYFFLNYCPMSLAIKENENQKKAKRVLDFPRVWEGHYLKFHYLHQAREHGMHAGELAARSKGKSFSVAALLAKRFVLGESKEVNKKVTSYITAAEKKFLVAGDQTLDKFQFNIDWNAQHTEFPSRRLTSSINNMQWRMGYKDIDTGTERGTLNSVIGVTSKDDESKLRGSRGVLYVLEEWGTFPKLLDLYNNLRPSVEDGEDVFGMIVGIGTAGDKDSDFAAAQEIMSNPRGYNMYPIPNVFDKEGQGKREFVFFFPGYVNRAGCYDADGNSDVTKALLQIYIDRYTVKYNSTDINSITKRIAEIPITPQEAMQKVKGNMFPITELTNRLNQLDANPSEMDDVYTGTLVFNSSNKVEFMPTTELPIREFPLSDNKAAGTVEIFKMPETDSSGHIPTDRYIASLDPVDADQADTLSLCSIFVLDLWTDKIVCEYTGRQPFADDNFELLRKICLFYNAKCLYENNLKGTFSYFSKMNSLYLLADTPTYLKDRDLIKSTGIGNTAKGVNASLPINNYANRLIRDWLLKPVTFLQKSPEGNEEEVTIPNLFNLRNRALLKELILYHPETNCDRIRSLGMLMLYREEKMILYEGDFSGMKERPKGLESDDFFNRNKPRNKRKRDVNVTDIL